MSPKPGFRRGILTTQSRPAREYAHSDSHRTFLCGLSMGLNLAKSPLFALCIFQPSSFSQTPLQHARPGRGSLGGRVARDASPSGDCDPQALKPSALRKLLRSVARDASPSGDCDPGLGPVGALPRGCTRCFPVRGLRHSPMPQGPMGATHGLHEMLPRQGIATPSGCTPGPARACGRVARDASPSGDCDRAKKRAAREPSRVLHEMLPRQGIATQEVEPRPQRSAKVRVARDASPSGDCDFTSAVGHEDTARVMGLHEMLPRQGIATPKRITRSFFMASPLLHEMLPRQGIATFQRRARPMGRASGVARDASPSGDCDPIPRAP